MQTDLYTNLKYTFHNNDRFIYVKEPFECNTPFLKILKPIHVTYNKKNTVAKKYLIVETSDELDFNNKIGEFMYIINKIHEISQEKIRENSLTWFHTEFDDIGLDMKIKRPIDQNRTSEFIKIVVPSSLEEDVSKLQKGEYVSGRIFFKGLKVSAESIVEEWELKEFITQTQYEEEERMAKFMEEDVPELIEEPVEEPVAEVPVEEPVAEVPVEEPVAEEPVAEEPVEEGEVVTVDVEPILNEYHAVSEITDKTDLRSIRKESKKKKSVKKEADLKTTKTSKTGIEIKKKSKKIIFTK